MLIKPGISYSTYQYRVYMQQRPLFEVKTRLISVVFASCHHCLSYLKYYYLLYYLLLGKLFLIFYHLAALHCFLSCFSALISYAMHLVSQKC